jgi:hypothetical protein
MTTLLIIAGMVAFAIGWNYFMVRLSGRPWWNPLWMAFTLTAVALLYGPAGVIGYSVPMHNPFIDRPAVWVGHVVWPQVEMASAIALISVFFWWQGLRRL